MQHLKAERYLLACLASYPGPSHKEGPGYKAMACHTGVSKFMDTISVVYGMYTELSLFSANPLLSA